MGGHRVFNEQGGFNQYLYRTVTQMEINGMQVTTITKIDEANHHSGMPFYSQHSDVYLKMESDSDEIIQAIIYKNRRAVLEIDWGHSHHGKKGHPSFKEGEVHVHTLTEENGKVVRSKEPARWMNDEEMKKYGPIIRYANPNAKMR